MTYQIISDGSCDLPQELTREKNIRVVPFYVSFDGEHYYKEMEEISVRDFYQQMVDKSGVYPKSSMPSIQDYYDAFKQYAQNDIPIICICITEKFSGSYDSAVNAKNMILETYKNAKIAVINSQVDTVLQGIYVLEACRLRDAGYSYKESVERLLSIRGSGRIFFTVGNIEYLRHGGRIGKLAGIAGTFLQVKPLITLKDGEIFPSGITRSRSKSMEKVIELLTHYLDETFHSCDEYQLCIGYGYSLKEAKEFRALALSKLSAYGVKEVSLYQIGATIGVHTGPYPLGFGIIRKACE